MSGWDDYITTIKASNPCVVEEVAIWGWEPGAESQWASSPGMTGITREEIQRLCGDRTLLQSSGTTLGGIKCIIIRDNMDDDKEPTLHMQTKPDSDGNSNFIVVAKSHKALFCAKGAPGSKLQYILGQLSASLKQLRDCGM